MRKISLVFVLIMLSEIVLAGVRPVQIIRCVARGVAAKTTVTKAITSTNHFCSPENATATLPNSCDAGTVTMTIDVTGTFLVGDALTIRNMSNMIFADGTHLIVDTLTTTTPEQFRPAFVADVANEIEIEFTRDLTQPSVIELRNANNGAGVTFTIPACATAVNPIPTMGEWGLMSLGLILLIFGVIAIRQVVSKSAVIE